MAFSLYPHITFEDSMTLVCVHPNEKVRKALQKYQARDFHTVGLTLESQLPSHFPQRLLPYSRHIGDSSSWVLKLDTAGLNISRPKVSSSMLFGNAWNMYCYKSNEGFCTYRTSSDILEHIILKYPYTASSKTFSLSSRALPDLRDQEFLRLMPEDQKLYIRPFFRYEHVPSTVCKVPWKL
ncbi:MAG TPA: hypothetical protein VGO47_04590 [Chlamydiales bacterium]|nr:hypothetical protein [Chlamydiales bacterium]